jgi:sigma-B regulation protein RsbU (phosphoserine phosphatase)
MAMFSGSATAGPVLGVLPDVSYEDRSITLGLGDRLVLFTDGVTEARNRDGEEFGDERLISIIRACGDGVKAGTLMRAIVDGLQKFSDGAFQDDVTVLTVTS